MESIRKLFAPVDMTVGDPLKQIILFTIPMLLGNFAQQLYSTVDSIIVGKFVGDNALAAVGTTGPIINLMIALFVGISVGASVMVSQYFGAKKREELSQSIGTCIVLTALASIFIMVVGSLMARPVLTLMRVPAEILDWSVSYIQILFLGFAGMGYYNILGGVLRGLGDSFSALVYLIIATIINIILDYSFVAFFGMGVVGVALATIIAQFISAIFTLRKLMRMTHVFDFNKRYLKLNKEYSANLIKLGLPSGITQGIFSLSILVTQALTNTFGAMYIAANVIVMRVDGFVMLPAMTFGTAMTTYSGQNTGANRMDRVMEGAKRGTIFAISVSVILSVLIVIFGKQLMGIFTNTKELIEISYHVMLILLTGYIVVEISQCLQGTMRGAGDTTTPMWISLGTNVIFRVPMAYLLVYLTKSPELPQGNFYMMSTALLCNWILGALLTLFFFKRGRWKNKAVVREEGFSHRGEE